MATTTIRVPQQRRPVEPRSDGLGQVAALARDGFAGLPETFRSPRRAAVWALWLVGIVGDSATTLVLLRNPALEEANPAAALGMGFLGLTGYVALATLICLVMATISTGRPTGPVARVAVAFLLLVAAGKVFAAVHNLVLWRNLHGVQ